VEIHQIWDRALIQQQISTKKTYSSVPLVVDTFKTILDENANCDVVASTHKPIVDGVELFNFLECLKCVTAI